METKMKWEVRISNQGNPDVNMLTLNGILIPASKVEIVNDANDKCPALRITLPMVASVGNDITIITDTTPFLDQLVMATGKEKGE
jgi:hypothetical protein